jgi:hypothetical protein
MREQVVPYPVAESFIFRSLTNENVKLSGILKRLRVHFGDETLPRTQVYDCIESFKEGRTEVENMRRLYLLQRKLWPTIFGTFKQRTINTAYFSKLLKDGVTPAFRSKRRRLSAKSVCLLQGNARPNTAAVTRGALGGTATPRL